jgi:hypothetical protein
VKQAIFENSPFGHIHHAAESLHAFQLLLVVAGVVAAQAHFTEVERAAQNDYSKTRNYWKYLKAKLKKEGSEVVSATTR